MKLFVTLLATLVIAGCVQSPPELCDREAQEWNKFDTVEDACNVPATPITPTGEEWGDDDPRVQPDTPKDDPVDGTTPEDDTPSSRGKGNNGWGNGDQSAPGNSLNNNRAENGGGSHRNHGQSNKN